ncbi:unnamed protein product [Moneuplotes crassus]|uniref:Uncharacterized protein n=1 Tax=Euplotes crassus TaxID=5936 RepID=A0AAD1XDJ7_EUPCR|nr:unnamed protein product [Moneuplotes crassus]
MGQGTCCQKRVNHTEHLQKEENKKLMEPKREKSLGKDHRQKLISKPRRLFMKSKKRESPSPVQINLRNEKLYICERSKSKEKFGSSCKPAARPNYICFNDKLKNGKRKSKPKPKPKRLSCLVHLSRIAPT